MVATPLQAELSRVIPEWREGTGSLGSATLELSGGCPEAFAPIVEQLAQRFRKVWYDFTRGVAVYMAPSASHERNARAVLELVQALCECTGTAVVAMGASTARPPGGSAAADPDESFFVGGSAERFLETMQVSGFDAAVADMEAEPRDLVIEVEHSHLDQDKRGIYAAAGVAELWELATGAAGRAPAIWHLRDQPVAAFQIGSSRVLPGVQAAALPHAMEELRRVGGLVGLVRGVERGLHADRRLMAAAGMTVRPE